uniref:Uncharacterized protein n=2 Tax=viral metagenome TaxID=1070528 RepID=A0A6M3M5B7_9ZZZZ
MTIEVYDMTKAIREAARAVALERVKLCEMWDRKNYFDTYSDLERNWQGCIAEVYLRQIYPMFDLGQPLVVEGGQIAECDYVYKDKGIELKCNRFKKMYNYFLKNVGEHSYKGYTAELLICTGINGPPSTASIFWIFGWISMEDIEKCDVWKPGPNSNVRSPAYAIPRDQLKPLSELFYGGDFSLSQFLK